MSSSNDRSCWAQICFVRRRLHQATVLGNFIEPDEKCAGAFKFRGVRDSPLRGLPAIVSSASSPLSADLQMLEREDASACSSSKACSMARGSCFSRCSATACSISLSHCPSRIATPEPALFSVAGHNPLTEQPLERLAFPCASPEPPTRFYL